VDDVAAATVIFQGFFRGWGYKTGRFPPELTPAGVNSSWCCGAVALPECLKGRQPTLEGTSRPPRMQAARSAQESAGITLSHADLQVDQCWVDEAREGDAPRAAHGDVHATTQAFPFVGLGN
jgi:hypothetical protein